MTRPLISETDALTGLHPAEKRVEINLGYACNNRCLFCSEALRRRAKPDAEQLRALATKAVAGTLLRASKQGYRHLTFLGGEPSLRADFLDLVRVAQKLGFGTILLTTNGRRLHDMAYARALAEAGVTELYLSLHGPDAASHDAAVRAPGAFDQLRAGLDNLRTLALPFHIASVLFKGNETRWPELLEFSASFEPRRIFWAFVRPSGAARESFDEVVPVFSETAASLEAALHIAEARRLPLTVAHVPYCRMRGFERFVDELHWNTGTISREVERYVAGEAPASDARRTRVTKGHRKIKGPDCVECRYLQVCEGVHEEYVRRRGFLEFRPVLGGPLANLATLKHELGLPGHAGGRP